MCIFYWPTRIWLPLLQFCSNLVPNHAIYAPRSLPTVSIGNFFSSLVAFPLMGKNPIPSSFPSFNSSMISFEHMYMLIFAQKSCFYDPPLLKFHHQHFLYFFGPFLVFFILTFPASTMACILKLIQSSNLTSSFRYMIWKVLVTAAPFIIQAGYTILEAEK